MALFYSKEMMDLTVWNPNIPIFRLHSICRFKSRVVGYWSMNKYLMLYVVPTILPMYAHTRTI